MVLCYKAQSVFSKHVLYYFNTYISFCKKQMFDVEEKSFLWAGVELDAFVQVEHCFKININLYNKTEDGVCSVLRQSLANFILV